VAEGDSVVLMFFWEADLTGEAGDGEDEEKEGLVAPD